MAKWRTEPTAVDADLPGEEWKVIEGFEDYAISTMGRVKRVTAARAPTFPGKVLVGGTRSGGGYAAVGLRRDRKNHVRQLHKLVAAAFLGPAPPKHEINHKDGNKLNPRLDNLEYVTRRQNHQHASKVLGRWRGAQNGAVKLTDEAIPEIRRRLAAGDFQYVIARDYGVTQTTIGAIALGRTWTHVP